MPAYQYRCANKHEVTRFFRVRDYEEAVDCEQCNLAAVRIFTAPAMVKVSPDIAYDSPIDGRHITTHAARQEDLKRNRCIPYDPGMKQDAQRRVQEMDAALESSIEETVCREVAKMPSPKKQQLVKELVNHGLSAEVTNL